jgi:hypothetical protein
VSQEAADAYNRKEIRAVLAAFKAMNEQATEEAKQKSGALAEFLRGKVISKSYGRTKAASVARGIAEGSKVSKSSKIGELSIGFASQKFSGGGTTKELWGGMEFGSKNFRQFPSWNPQGWFIYPALRENQTELVKQWEEAFSEIIKRFE